MAGKPEALSRPKVGKLPAELLGRLLREHAPRLDPRVIVGPGIGEDAAAIDLGDRVLVAKCDPITFVADDIGFYAVTVNGNDVACMGARPAWFLATLLLPEGAADERSVERIFAEVGAVCRARGIGLVGGHTEVTSGVTRPIVAGFLLGEAAKEKLVRKSDARTGDVVLVAKGVPIEAVSIIARERSEEVAAIHGQAFLDRCRDFLRVPGIDIAEDAAAAAGGGGVHAMHDPTEGGIATGLRELAVAAGLGMRIEADRIRVVEEGRILCEQYGMDPLGAIASGALVLAVAPEEAGGVEARLARRGTPVARVGTLVAASDGVRWRRSGVEEEVPSFEPDEIVKLFS